MKKAKVFLKVDDGPLHKITKRILEEKGYVVVEDLGNAEADGMAKVAIIGLNNYHGKLLADKLREMIPNIGIIPFFSDYVDYGDLNTTCTELTRIDELIASVIQKKGRENDSHADK
ncbi:MAG: hypothetical protein COS26_02425 [Candidatus Nealsonbacteria bacterium CG02_land_8_20_14_3_00_40_11]|uniref:Response regulatory domain-containing protein n=1 Tax=Candidatus Nealsonbacteria bacterium CG02_land_8_20_14_3_00_40_11 TaxID=1974700 RepID=A0A2M7D7M4_9BACT|nr:MAG: hypothetical protein COS26_02425 [Candidatus Nealsonbacteria bacterium CG02_land_8_20_14_3_00_40_11]